VVKWLDNGESFVAFKMECEYRVGFLIWNLIFLFYVMGGILNKIDIFCVSLM
jgi:hypothetical protein